MSQPEDIQVRFCRPPVDRTSQVLEKFKFKCFWFDSGLVFLWCQASLINLSVCFFFFCIYDTCVSCFFLNFLFSSSVNQIWKTLGSWGSVAGMVAPEIQIIIRFGLCLIRFHWWKIRKNYKLVERFAHRNISWNKLKQPKSCGIKSNMQTAAICWNIFHEIECKRAGNPM